MIVTLEALAKRIDRLETQIAAFSNGLGGAQAVDLSDPRRVKPPQVAVVDQQALSAAFDKFCQNAGINCDPIPAEELQQRIAAHLLKKGIKPEDNVFSREIIAMREE